MKSTAVHVGNVKLRGKSTKMLSCGCCDVVNFKRRERVKEAEREIREARKVGVLD
jgi:hypothetical protein